MQSKDEKDGGKISPEIRMDAAREEKPAPQLNSPFLTKAENYWYHYKWPTILGLFALIIVLVCTLQMCNKEHYDNHVMYAGPQSPSKVQLTAMQTTLNSLAKDQDKDGSTNVSLERYWIETKDVDGLLAGNVFANWESVQNEIQAGEATVCFVSPEVFKKLLSIQEKDDDGNVITLLVDLTGIYRNEDEAYFKMSDHRSAYGVYLKELPFGDLPGFSALPDDTVVCLRRPSEMKYWLGKQEEAKEMHRRQTELMHAILSYEAPEEPTESATETVSETNA